MMLIRLLFAWGDSKGLTVYEEGGHFMQVSKLFILLKIMTLLKTYFPQLYFWKETKRT